MAVSLTKAVVTTAQATIGGSTPGDTDNALSDRRNATRAESGHKHQHFVDVTETGEPCLPNPLLDRVVDLSLIHI